MKLYRGYRTRPKVFTLKSDKELNELKVLYRDSGAESAENVIDAIKKMGVENFTRFTELRRLAGPQFYTDDESIARGFAGEKGFVHILEIEDDAAREHYQGSQLMAPAGEPRIANNFVFRGRELMQHPEWKRDFIEMEREEAEKEIKPSGIESSSVFRTIREPGNLSTKDRDALREFQKSLEPKSSEPSEGKPSIS